MYGNASFAMLSVAYGVPQGSTVGQILFIMFINGIVRSSCATKLAIYADDTKALASDNK